MLLLLNNRKDKIVNNFDWKEIWENVFLIESDGYGVIYSPLQGIIFAVTKEGILELGTYLKKEDYLGLYNSILKERGIPKENSNPVGRIPRRFASSELNMGITYECNLACIGCYAKAGEESRRLSWEKIQIAIDKLVEYVQELNEDSAYIGFNSTGETTLRWEILERAVNYARSVFPENIKLQFSLTTNACLLNIERVKFLKEKNFFVRVSMDGLKSSHNRQRPKKNGGGSFDDVVKGIKELVKQNVWFSIRTTITGYNQGEMPEFAKFLYKLGCKDVVVVPFSAVGRASSGITPVNPEIFIKKYIDAYKIAQQIGFSFSMPGVSLEEIDVNYCLADGNIFAVMPDGSITSCTRVTKQGDLLSEIFVIGEIDDGRVKIDQKKVDKLGQLNLNNYPECQYCFAKFSCSGGCPHERFSGSWDKEAHCKMVRSILWYKLLEITGQEQYYTN